MKRFFLALGIFCALFLQAQIRNIKSGEQLSYRIHYGLLTAGNAVLTANYANYQGEPHLHVKGVGRSSGAVRAFFKVDDIYESYIDMKTGLPSYYIRNVSEGSYRRLFETTFDHESNTLVLNNKLKNEAKKFNTIKGVQDMLSSFYFLRNMDNSQFKVGSAVKMNVWIDDEIYPFMLKVAGIEMKNTKFGKISCLKIIPSVMSGRVFKDQEGVTLWVTNDANHIPVEIKAELAVGSLKASIDGYENVKYPPAFTK